MWRGIEYYKQSMVLSYTLNVDSTCDGVVAHSNDEKYNVHVDMEHPKFRIKILNKR